MIKKKVLILLGHPDNDSLNYTFADGYERGARETGHEVHRVNIADLKFDPILHHGYKLIQELEPDLKRLQEEIRWCNHFVVIYPLWWSSLPALLKGLFDRIWLPGFAFRFWPSGLGWTRLLKGRTARVFVSSDLHPLPARFIFGDITNELRNGILRFAGFSVSIKKIWPVKNISPERKVRWIRKFEKYGRKLS